MDQGTPIRPVGRPRIEASSATKPPREEIVAAATRLFAERGYSETTMSDIARAVGLQQSSLYYWFRRKEHILQEALTVNRAPLEFVGRIGAGSGSPALKLYRLLRFDTYQLCLSPIDFNEIERIAENQPEDFVEFWQDYTRLHDWVVNIVRAGIAEGEFLQEDPVDLGIGLLCLNEATQKRYRYQHNHGPTSASPFTHPPKTAADWADMVATRSLRSVLCRPDEVNRLRRQASRLGDLTRPDASTESANRPMAPMKANRREEEKPNRRGPEGAGTGTTL